MQLLVKILLAPRARRLLAHDSIFHGLIQDHMLQYVTLLWYNKMFCNIKYYVLFLISQLRVICTHVN
jgi:hypothetical protein